MGTCTWLLALYCAAMRPLIILAALVALAAPAGAKPVDMAQALGYVVFAVDTVKGTFEGCEHGRQIEFEAGGAVECLEYGYQYAYRPTAALLVTVQDDVILCRLIVDDSMFDVECAPYVRFRMDVLRSVAREQNRWLRVYAAMGL